MGLKKMQKPIVEILLFRHGFVTICIQIAVPRQFNTPLLGVVLFPRIQFFADLLRVAAVSSIAAAAMVTAKADPSFPWHTAH